MNKSDALLSDQLDSVNSTKLAEVLANLVFSHLLGQVTQIDVTRSTRLLNSEGDGRRD